MRVDGSIETTWKHYMMFSGTSLLMHSERVDIEGSSSSNSSGSSALGFQTVTNSDKTAKINSFVF